MQACGVFPPFQSPHLKKDKPSLRSIYLLDGHTQWEVMPLQEHALFPYRKGKRTLTVRMLTLPFIKHNISFNLSLNVIFLNQNFLNCPLWRISDTPSPLFTAPQTIHFLPSTSFILLLCIFLFPILSCKFRDVMIWIWDVPHKAHVSNAGRFRSEMIQLWKL